MIRRIGVLPCLSLTAAWTRSAAALVAPGGCREAVAARSRGCVRVVAYSYQTTWFGTMPVDQLSATFAALADPTRRAILARLVEGEATVNELAAPFPMSAQAVGKHLRVLERAGLIERRRTAQLRPSRLRAVALKDAAEWLDDYRAFWEAGFDRMDERLRADD
jgi:DNA-binding transcriptional ArsR family regulator